MRFRLLIAGCLALFSTSFAGLAHAQEAAATSEETTLTGTAPAPIDRPPPSTKVTVVVAGLATTVVAYGLALGASYMEPEYTGAKELRIPVAGPWMALGKTGCPKNDPGCTPGGLVIGVLLTVIDGVLQAGGLGIAAEGLFLNTSSGSAPPRKKAERASVKAVPLDFGGRGAGLGFVGTF